MASVKVAGYTWDLFTGYNGAMRVYSFVVPNGSPIYSFNADVKEFFNYLQTNQNFPESQQYMLSKLARFVKLTVKSSSPILIFLPPEANE